MFRLFLHHDSPLVRTLEIIGVVGMAVFFASDSWWVAWQTTARVGLGVFLCGYLFLRYCASVRWYARPTPAATVRKYLGIELHFRRMLVLCSYVGSLTALWLSLGGWPVFLWAMNAILIFFSYGNGLLLWFHYHDRSPVPVNFYSARETSPQPQPAVQTRPQYIDTVTVRHI